MEPVRIVCFVQMAEISRVLQPGGVFVASTFLKAAAPLGELTGWRLQVVCLGRPSPASICHRLFSLSNCVPAPYRSDLWG